ncbi:MAG TPA: thiolase family protein, partial [Thermodesulfobacteriota bacterium]|nr:thiolase family protein [Thermodesulfobacteriota bacterium]
MATQVYVAGVGMTKFGKSQKSLPELMVEAASRAMIDSGVRSVDYVLIGVMSVEEFTGEGNIAAVLADRLGLTGVPSSRVETASSTGSAVFESAFYALASGYHRNVLIIAGEKMTHLPTAQTTKILAEVIEGGERKYGASMPALAAMITRRYQHDSGLSEKQMESALSRVAIKNHYNGSLNPYAQFRKIITSEDYSRSKWVATPLRTYDCAPITDGAVSMILTSDKKLVRVSGLGHATDTLAVRHRDSLTSFKSTRLAAWQAYNMAKVNPKDVSFAEVHDAFTTFEIIGTEDLGFFPPGKGWKAVEEGVTSIKGRLPINPSGGLKARGHPVGASGLAQIAEVFLQLRGDLTPERQIPGARIGLTQ